MNCLEINSEWLYKHRIKGNFFFVFILSIPFVISAQKKQCNANDTFKLLENARKNGYFLAKVENCINQSCVINFGRKYKAAFLKNNLLFFEVNKIQQNRAVAINNLENCKNNWLSFYNNHGYPFAVARYKVVSDSLDIIYLIPEITLNQEFYLDSISTNNTIKPQFILNLANEKLHNQYNIGSIFLIKDRINYLQQMRINNISHTIIKNKLLTSFLITQQKRDNFTGIIGLASNTRGRATLTGELKIALSNIAKRCISIELDWRSFKSQSQQLNTNLVIPYPFGKAIIPTFFIDFSKLDTTYTQFVRGLELDFPIAKNTGIIVGYTQNNFTRISSEVLEIINFRNIPNNASTQSKMYQLGIKLNTKNNLFLPTKGWFLQINFNVGNRKFIKDAEYSNIVWRNQLGKLENLFDSLDRTNKLRTTVYYLQYKHENYVPIGKYFCLKNYSEIAWKQQQQIGYNELIRYGGVKNFKGFNEQSIFANKFAMWNSELRLIFGQSGLIGFFVGMGYMENNFSKATINNSVLYNGGLSAAFKTRAGIIQMAWALGKSKWQNFAFNQSKFHFILSNSF